MALCTLVPDHSDLPVIALNEGETCRIGRQTDNAVPLAHASISRHHAELRAEGGIVTLRDLGSRNGTRLNGAPVEEARVQHRDLIEFGSVRYVAEIDGGVTDSAQTVVRQFEPDAAQFTASDAQLSLTHLKVHLGPRHAGDAERLATLLSISHEFAMSANREELLETILSELKDVIPYEQAAVLLFDAHKRLVPVALRPKADGDRIQQHVSMTIVREALRGGEAVLTTDAQTDPRFQESKSVADFHVRSAVCLPLTTSDGSLGALYLDNRGFAGNFTDGDLQYLSAFAAQAALALSHTALQERLREQDVVRERFSRFFSPSTVQTILRGDASITRLGGEEREVTVLFSDIRGFTEMSEELAPSAVADMLNEYFPTMVNVVFEHDGTLEKYIGDALMAIWGAPIAHHDDPVRAVRAAVRMQEATADLNGWWAEQDRPYRIHIGIGINTGIALTGNIGSERYLQYAAIGDATNTASRICSAAASGEILLSKATLTRIDADAVRVGATRDIELKGKREPVTVCSVQF